MFVERINYESMKMGLNITKKPVRKLLQNIMIDILGFFKKTLSLELTQRIFITFSFLVHSLNKQFFTGHRSIPGNRTIPNLSWS